MISFFFFLILFPEVYHGINGNVSLDRHGELLPPQNRYDLTLGSDKSSSLSRSERDGGSYDVIQAEAHAKNEQQAMANYINNNNLIVTNGTSTLESIDSESRRKKLPQDKGYQYAKEFLMTERTYTKDLDVLNKV